MRILLLSKYPRMGASSRLRSLQYLPRLEADGFNVTVSSLFDDTYLTSIYKNEGRSALTITRLYFKRLLTLLHCHKYDLIWIEKEVFPYLPATAERFLRLLGKPYIVDYDDAIFHNYDLSRNPLIRRFLSHKIDTVMRYSSCVIAGNAYLAERARAAGSPRVELIPTVVNHQRYTPRTGADNQRPVIGWIGSPSTQKYLTDIREALVNVCIKQGARLMLVGATPQVVAELPGIDVEVIPWSEEKEAALIRQMDVGIMPLPDGPWEKGKCGYKLIQYMACAVPVIASPVGVNVDIVSESQSGLLVHSLADWESALQQLIESAEHRAKLGIAGRQAVEQTYSLQAQSLVLRKIFTETIFKKSTTAA